MTLALVLGWLRKVPREVWLILAFGLVVLWLRSHWIGVGEERCRQAQEVAERAADERAKGVAARSQAKAQEAREGIRKETDDDADEIREVVRYLPRTCPAVPDGVRERGRAAVEAARAGVLPAPGG